MIILVYILVILDCSVSLPSWHLPWEYIKGRNAYLQPIDNDTVYNEVSGRVIGGREITAHSRPYQVAVLVNGRSFCGGSMVSRNYVLTAAHCTISASFVELIFGAHNIQSEESSQLIVASTNIVNHPQYVTGSILNDISLIQTPVSIVTNSRIRIVTLASADAPDYTGAIGFFTGWGSTSHSSTTISPVLHGVDLSVISNTVCSGTYGSLIQPSILCTSGIGVVGWCSGDSGGPLVVGSLQVGVAAFVSSNGCEGGRPSGFTRVSSFKTWISQNSDVSL